MRKTIIAGLLLAAAGSASAGAWEGLAGGKAAATTAAPEAPAPAQEFVSELYPFSDEVEAARAMAAKQAEMSAACRVLLDGETRRSGGAFTYAFVYFKPD